MIPFPETTVPSVKPVLSRPHIKWTPSIKRTPAAWVPKLLFFSYLMRLLIIIVNWEIFCWPADGCLTHVHLSCCSEDLPSWFASCNAVGVFCLLFAPAHPPRDSVSIKCSGKFTFLLYCSPLSDQCDRCRGREWTRGRLPWLPRFVVFCPHSIIACIAHNWHLRSI